MPPLSIQRKRGGKGEEGKDGRNERRWGDMTKEGERREERKQKDHKKGVIRMRKVERGIQIS